MDEASAEASKVEAEILERSYEPSSPIPIPPNSLKNSPTEGRLNDSYEKAKREYAKKHTIHVCERCKREIIPTRKDKKITSDDGLMYWHEGCFNCQNCTKSLCAIGYFINEVDGRMYCDRCMDERCAVTCSRCNKLIMAYSQDEEIVESLDGEQQWHQQCVPLFKDAISHC